MPKRYLDVSNTMPLDRVQRKTERSHEENQERAYVAASRRADRSIEARVQSARMASDIHKRRTGRGFKISEEIVMKEEMYEEEEDDLPRYRTLAALAQHPPGSADIHERFSQFAAAEIGLGKLERMREIERQFEESFPNAAHLSQSNFMGQVGARPTFQHLLQQQQQQNRQQQQQQNYKQQRQRHQQQEPPNRGYSHSPMLECSSQYPRERSHSISQVSAALDMAARRHTIAAGMASHHSLQPQLRTGGLGDDAGSSSLSPPALTPGATGSSGSSSSGGNGIETPSTQYQPSFAPSSVFSTIPATTSVDAFGNASITSGPDGIPFLYPSHSTTNFHHSPESETDTVEQVLGSGWNDESAFYREPSVYPRDMDLETRDTCGGCFDQRPPSAAGSVGMPQSQKAPQPHQQAPLSVTSVPDDYFGHVATITAGPPLTRFEGLIGPRSAAVTPGTDGFETFFDMENYSRAVAAASAGAPPWNNQAQN
ncbi:hypothetical protein RB595_003980 [Gaeumannomyces hyphopodioides]